MLWQLPSPADPQAALTALSIAQLITLALALAALLAWRFRFRERVVYVAGLADAEASMVAEDLEASMLVVFTGEGRTVASANLDEQAAAGAAAVLREGISSLSELGMSVERMLATGSGVSATIVRLAEVDGLPVYAAAFRPGARPPDPGALRREVERRFGDLLGEVRKPA
ncbi:MAG: hypothetical protein QXW56_06000 [Nitrososphaerota archaeon]